MSNTQFHAILLITRDPYSTAQKYSQFKLNEPHIDLHVLEATKQKIGISEIRELKKTLRLPPVSANHHLVYIPYANTLSIQAQNAMLKLLEEPPRDVKFIIATSTLDQILPTVVSRCQVVWDTQSKEISPDITELKNLVKKISEAKMGEKVSLAQQYTKSESLQEFLKDMLYFLHQELHQKAQINCVENIQTTLAAMKLQQSNANPRLIMEWFLFRYK